MNIGNAVHIQTNSALPYLALAYALFFVGIFVYTLTLSRRQARLQDDLALLRRAVDEERRDDPRG